LALWQLIWQLQRNCSRKWFIKLLLYGLDLQDPARKGEVLAILVWRWVEVA